MNQDFDTGVSGFYHVLGRGTNLTQLTWFKALCRSAALRADAGPPAPLWPKGQPREQGTAPGFGNIPPEIFSAPTKTLQIATFSDAWGKS